ncbi:MAG TPA: twin-arginine translocase TatA/TatE family subunit [Candidatus Limnocylindrales bacterium]|nr:twin-arginine translocase TatA/TatE family subunit [Candidatus Limnocylindrales bacterium]
MPLPSGFEWIVILVIALLILGPGKLPDVAASVGKSIREFRKASADVQEAVKVDTSPLPAGPTATAPAPVAAAPGPVAAVPATVAAAPAPVAAVPAPVAAEPVQEPVRSDASGSTPETH